MEEDIKNSASSIFETVSQILSENSDTLDSVNTSTEKQTPVVSSPVQWSLGRAPIKTPEDPNFEIYKQSAEEGDNTALIDVNETPENMQSAVNILLGAPEFKEFIGQYALSNDVSKNIETIQRAISQQKNFEETPERIGEVDGKFFTGGEAYFLQELLNRIQDSEGQGDFNGSEDANTFFNQLRNDINTEVLQKIEKKENIESETADNNQPEPKEEDDAFSKTKKILNEREGELVEDLTPAEAWDEMRRILSSPEYQRAQTEEIGYDSSIGHPDLEIREYQTKMNEWRKQLPHPEIDKPEPPENYEERRNKPKRDYDRFIKEGLSHEDAISAIHTQSDQQITPATPSRVESEQNKEQLIEPATQTELEPKISEVEPVSTKNLYQEVIPQEQATLETTSELPTSDMFAQAEESKDETSAEILANTEKTNITLEGLTQVLGMLMQTLGTQMQQPPPVPPQVPTSQASFSEPGMPDAMLASGSGMIPTIRSKFVYSV